MDNPFTATPEYAGIIKAPDFWWLSKSKPIYDAFDMPEGHIRDMILSVAEDMGLLIKLGPGTMTSAQAFASAQHAFGQEVTPDHAFDSITALSEKGQDLIAGTGIFAPDYDDE